mgnify:FL=1|tara:strand:+ start:93 stop:332 length:240 start_codon:yes stop_codon:yes gene_type:complete
MIREKDKEKKAIDNIDYKDAKDDMQKDNGIKVANANFNKIEIMDLKKLGYGKAAENPSLIGKDKETGIKILKEILKLNK